MFKYIPFILSILTITLTIIFSQRIKDKIEKKYVLAMFIAPQIVYFIGYLKAFSILYKK